MAISRTKEALEWRMQQQISLFYLWKNELGELETGMEAIPDGNDKHREMCAICITCFISDDKQTPITMLHMTGNLYYCFKCRDAILEKLPDPVCIKGCDE